jgi:DNA repair protein RadC
VHKPISNWALDDKPRNKMIHKGPVALSNAELVAILIGSGTTSESAVGLSKRMLAEVNNDLNELATLDLAALQAFKGVGAAKAVCILAAIELGRRRVQSTAMERAIINSSASAAALLKPVLSDLSHEEFWVIYLNNSNRFLGLKQISKGGLTGTIADPRKIFKLALELKSTGLILSHNHPSGNLEPSQADKNLTKQMQKAGNALQISILDHLILSSKGYYSFSDEGEI